MLAWSLGLEAVAFFCDCCNLPWSHRKVTTLRVTVCLTWLTARPATLWITRTTTVWIARLITGLISLQCALRVSLDYVSCCVWNDRHMLIAFEVRGLSFIKLNRRHCFALTSRSLNWYLRIGLYRVNSVMFAQGLWDCINHSVLDEGFANVLRFKRECWLLDEALLERIPACQVFCKTFIGLKACFFWWVYRTWLLIWTSNLLTLCQLNRSLARILRLRLELFLTITWSTVFNGKLHQIEWSEEGLMCGMRSMLHFCYCLLG